MGVFLARCATFEGRTNGVCGGDERWISDIGCGSRAAVSRIDELDGSHRGRESNGGEVEQARGILNLGFLQAEAVALHAAEHLLDAPAQAIEPHDVACGSELVGFTNNRQGREQAPDVRIFALGRVDLHGGRNGHGCR